MIGIVAPPDITKWHLYGLKHNNSTPSSHTIINRTITSGTTTSFHSADNIRIEIAADPTFARFLDGDCASVTIWNSVVSDEKIEAIFNGVPMFVIDHDNIVFYAPISGNESPEPDYSGNDNSLTLVDSPVKSPNPRVELLENYL